MKNFKSSVPVAVQAKIKALVGVIYNDLPALAGSRGETVTECRIEPIQGNGASGWLPFQDGGFYCSQFMRCDEDATFHFTKKQTEYMERQGKYCYEQFRDDKGIDALAELTPEQQEELTEYEQEWFEPADLQFQAFAEGFGQYSRSDKQQVTMRLSINYKDAPYYREKYAEDMSVICVDVAEFMETPIRDLIVQINPNN